MSASNIHSTRNLGLKRELLLGVIVKGLHARHPHHGAPLTVQHFEVDICTHELDNIPCLDLQSPVMLLIQ